MDSAEDVASKYTAFIEKLADTAYDQIWGQYKNLVKYNNYLIKKEIHESFIKDYGLMNSEMVEGTEHLSRYKIISAYVKALLTYPLFSLDEGKVAEFLKTKSIPRIVRVPNEIFICMMIQALIQKYSLKAKKMILEEKLDGKQYEFKYPAHLIHISLENDNGGYKNENTNFVLTLTRLFYWYRTVKGPQHFPLFVFAIILFLLEMTNDCVYYEAAGLYYV